MSRVHLTIILSCFAWVVQSTSAWQEGGALARNIAQQIGHELQTARVPGAGIAVVVGDDMHVTGYGVADVEQGTRMTADTLLQVGSLTKLVTALGIVAALDARQIPLDTRVGRYLTGLAPRADAATFHQLLSQTSGLRDRPGDTGESAEAALAASMRTLEASDFLLPAGTVFSYSNLGYALAGAALEALVQKPFADALDDAVLGPLTMSGSTMRPAEALKRPHAVGHRLNGAAVAGLQSPANDTRIWPAGYLWTSATDFSKLLVALMSQGRVAGRQVFASAAIARLTAEHTSMPNVFVGGHYGYGLMLARDGGTRIHEHGGTMPGFSSILRIAPDRRIGIAILANLDNAPLRRIAQAVMSTALALPEQKPAARQETAVGADEMKAFVGRYRNRGTAELAVREGRVVLILDDGPPLAVSRITGNRYLARPKPQVAGPEFVLQPATATAPSFLHFALWAYVKQ